jgi:hypothetical protein
VFLLRKSERENSHDDWPYLTLSKTVAGQSVSIVYRESRPTAQPGGCMM